MSRNRLLAVALVVVVLVAGAAWLVVDRGPTYGDHLERFSGRDAIPNKFVDLDDGSQLSVGSPDRHRVVVQWKSPDGHGWTAPKTVHQNKKDTVGSPRVRFGGSTAAIDAWFGHDSSSEDDTNGIDVQIVCVSDGHRCDVREDPGETPSLPEVTGDGRTVLFRVGSEQAVFWTKDGFRTEKVIVPAELADAPGSFQDTVLASDGSLRKMVGQLKGKKCTLNLLGSRPRSATFTTLTSVTKPFPDRFGLGECTDGISTWSSDWVRVEGWNGGSWGRFWFVRDGDEWRETHKDASGLIQPTYARGCRRMAQTQYVNPDNLSFGSPDGRRIRVQVHRHGAETWTKPVVLDGVPSDATMKCVSFNAARVGRDGFAVALFGGRPAYGRVVAVTQDQVHWRIAYLPGARGSLSVDDDDRVHIGKAVVWTPAGGFAAQK